MGYISHPDCNTKTLETRTLFTIPTPTAVTGEMLIDSSYRAVCMLSTEFQERFTDLSATFS